MQQFRACAHTNQERMGIYPVSAAPGKSLHTLTEQNPGENVGWSNPVPAGKDRALPTGEEQESTMQRELSASS